MSSEVLVAILTSSGIAAIITAVVAGLFSKKKLGAEATEIITKAAAGVVLNLEAENVRMAKKVDDLVAKHEAHITELVKSHATEIEEVRRVLQLHVAWDLIAIAKLDELNVKLPPAPPLLPARRFDHPH